MTLPGIDVSGYQTTTPTLTGLYFCIAKASEGLYAAPSYPMHLANTRKAGIVDGAYHFGRSDVSTPAAQAAFFLKTAGNVDLYALDVEGANAFTTAQSAEFIAVMHAAGKRVGMYHSLSGFQHAGQDWDWVAYYNATPPPIHWDIWQYGPRVIDGRKIDGDTFHGDAAALAALVDPTTGSTGALDMGFKAKLADPIVSGTLTVQPGTKLYRMSDRAEYDFNGVAFKRGAVKAISGPGSNGYFVDVAPPGGVMEVHFCYNVSTVSFEAQAVDCTAAVAAATAPLNARIAGIKAKVAAAATDISND